MIAERDKAAMYGAGMLGHTVVVVYSLKGERVLGIQCSDVARARVYVAEGREDPTIYRRQKSGWVALAFRGRRG